jgi:deoxycytidylate deaminase
LDLAIKLAGTVEGVRSRHGAVLVSGGRVLSLGVNKRRNMNIAGQRSPHYTYHAEQQALKGIEKPLHKATLYVARISKANSPVNSRPCSECYKLLVEYNIKEVVYTHE